MGQKVNPHGLRVGIIKDWDSRWYADANFADNLIEDHEIRTYLKKRLYKAGISKVEIERTPGKVKVIVWTAKPGIVIGKGGSEIEKIRGEVSKLTGEKLYLDQTCHEVNDAESHESRRPRHQDIRIRPSRRSGYGPYRVLL